MIFETGACRRCLKTLKNHQLSQKFGQNMKKCPFSTSFKSIFFNSRTFIHLDKEIQNNILYNFEFSHSGFPCSHDKRTGISKLFLSLFKIFFYISTPIPGTLKSNFGHTRSVTTNNDMVVLICRT